MRILLSCGILAIAGAAIAGCSRSAGAQHASAASKQAVPEIPKEADIFAVTVWTPTPDKLDALRAKATTRPTTQPTTGQAPWGSKQAPGTCWLSLRPQDDYWKGKFNVAPNDVREMLRTYHRVTHEKWKHFSHAGGGDVAGWLILNDGRCVQWMMKPGGLGWVRFSTGEMIYLSKTAPP
jgi:hypothetical protein